MLDLPAEQPLVSVIIPVYNAGRYLRETLDCVCGQTLREIEIICVDDGSTDDSLQILQEYAGRDTRLRILRQKNLYAGVARNHGMAEARGKYLSFLDADDRFEPEMLRCLFDTAEQVGADLVCCKAMGYDNQTGELFDLPWVLPGIGRQGVDTKSFVPLRDAPEELFSYSGSAPWNKLYRRSYVEKHHITWLETQSSNDLTFVCHCMALASRVSLLDKVLVYYRVRQDSIWHSKTKSPTNMYEAHLALLRRMVECNMPDTVINAVCHHLLGEMNWHLSGDACDNPAQRAELYVEGYESEFGLLKRGDGFLARHPVGSRLKAFAEPDVTVLIKPEGAGDGLEISIESLSQNIAEVVLDVSGADEDTLRYAESVARRYFWVRVSSGTVRPKAPVVAKLAPGRFLLHPAHLEKALKNAAAGTVLDLKHLTRRYRVWPLFYVCTLSLYSWRVFGKPVFTESYQSGKASRFLFRRQIAERDLQEC